MSEFADDSVHSRKCGRTDSDSKEPTETSLTREVSIAVLVVDPAGGYSTTVLVVDQKVAIAPQRLHEKQR